MPNFKRVVTMAISDANKRLMLEFEGLVGVLVKYLLVGSPRRGEEGGGWQRDGAAWGCTESVETIRGNDATSVGMKGS